MVFYGIELRSQPRLRFACSVQLGENGRKNIIDHRRNILEISAHEGCAMQVETAQGGYTVPEGGISLYMPDERYTITAGDHRLQCTSVAVEIDDWHFRRYDTDTPQTILPPPGREEPYTVYLPQVSLLPAEELSVFLATQQTILSQYLDHTAAAHMRCLAGWYTLVAMLDGAFRQQVWGETEKERRSGYYYVYKAQKYICSHFREPLTLPEIAAQLGISVNYLSTVFKRETGQTVLEYITGIRMQELRSRMHSEPERPLREICESVGLHDLRHAQRTFKRLHGISMQKCRQLDKGLTLYHANPWERTELDHDIFGEDGEKGENR